METIWEFLRRILEADLKLRRETSAFMTPFIVHIGYRIDAQKLHLMPEKVKALMDAPLPTAVTE